MRLGSLAASALMAALAVGYGGSAVALTASLSLSRDKTSVRERPNPFKMTPYAATIRQILLTEVKRSHVPFALREPAVFVVQFELDRRGQLIAVKVLRGSKPPDVDEYLEALVRRAAHQFPPAPAGSLGDRFAFMLPVSFE